MAERIMSLKKETDIQAARIRQCKQDEPKETLLQTIS